MSGKRDRATNTDAEIRLLRGKAKETTGTVTGNEPLRREGAAEQEKVSRESDVAEPVQAVEGER